VVEGAVRALLAKLIFEMESSGSADTELSVGNGSNLADTGGVDRSENGISSCLDFGDMGGECMVLTELSNQGCRVWIQVTRSSSANQRNRNKTEEAGE
jgi:hypothetical protein